MEQWLTARCHQCSPNRPPVLKVFMDSKQIDHVVRHRQFDTQVSEPMTLTEKIIAKACDRPSVAPNDNVWVKTDVLMTHDVCGPGTIGNFYKEFGPKAKVNTSMKDRTLYFPDCQSFSCRRGLSTTLGTTSIRQRVLACFCTRCFASPIQGRPSYGQHERSSLNLREHSITR